MKNMAKRTAVILAAVLLLGLLPAPALAVSEVSVEWAVEPTLEFERIGGFSEGLAMVEGLWEVSESGNRGSRGKCGYIDKNGKVVIPLEYEKVSHFYDGIASVSKDGKMGFIDKTGSVVIPLEYDNVFDFSEDLAPVKKDGKWGYIDRSGNMVIPPEYNDAYNFSESVAMVYKDKKFGFIDKNGNFVVPPIYDFVLRFSEGLAVVSMNGNGKLGYIDETGIVVIQIEYDFAYAFSEGLACVKKDGKWGFIDKNGNIVIPIEYDSADNFKNGSARIRKGAKLGFIDKNGNAVIPVEHDALLFSEGLAAVQKGYEWGYIDEFDNIIIPFEYAYAGPFKEGIARVYNIYNRCGFIDKTGKVIVPLEYDWVSFNEGLAPVKKDGKWGILRLVYSATPTASTVLVNGANVAFDAYNINGNNYFKLRDLAYILSGTEKQFEIGWDGANNSISLTSGEAYTPVGGEMEGKGSGDMSATPTTSRITLDGKEITLTAYNIGGNNYFRLRDIGAAFDFGIDWDGANNTIVIDTSKSYTPE